MICTQCGASCREGATRCPRCHAELVGGRAPAPHDEAEWVTDAVVLETSDETRLMAARSLLEAEGIPCFARGEEGQQLIGAGPMRLCVPVEHEAAARALLAQLNPAPPGKA